MMKVCMSGKLELMLEGKGVVEVEVREKGAETESTEGSGLY
jgi:hypothetical protein